MLIRNHAPAAGISREAFIAAAVEDVLPLRAWVGPLVLMAFACSVILLLALLFGRSELAVAYAVIACAAVYALWALIRDVRKAPTLQRHLENTFSLPSDTRYHDAYQSIAEQARPYLSFDRALVRAGFVVVSTLGLLVPAVQLAYAIAEDVPWAASAVLALLCKVAPVQLLLHASRWLVLGAQPTTLWASSASFCLAALYGITSVVAVFTLGADPLSAAFAALGLARGALVLMTDAPYQDLAASVAELRTVIHNARLSYVVFRSRYAVESLEHSLSARAASVLRRHRMSKSRRVASGSQLEPIYEEGAEEGADSEVAKKAAAAIDGSQVVHSGALEAMASSVPPSSACARSASSRRAALERSGHALQARRLPKAVPSSPTTFDKRVLASQASSENNTHHSNKDAAGVPAARPAAVHATSQGENASSTAAADAPGGSRARSSSRRGVVLHSSIRESSGFQEGKSAPQLRNETLRQIALQLTATPRSAPRFATSPDEALSQLPSVTKVHAFAHGPRAAALVVRLVSSALLQCATATLVATQSWPAAAFLTAAAACQLLAALALTRAMVDALCQPPPRIEMCVRMYLAARGSGERLMWTLRLNFARDGREMECVDFPPWALLGVACAALLESLGGALGSSALHATLSVAGASLLLWYATLTAALSTPCRKYSVRLLSSMALLTVALEELGQWVQPGGKDGAMLWALMKEPAPKAVWVLAVLLLNTRGLDELVRQLADRAVSTREALNALAARAVPGGGL